MSKCKECQELKNKIEFMEEYIKTVENARDELGKENAEIRKYQYEQDFLQQQLDQLKEQNDELKKVNNHIENNRKQKADKLMRIEKLIIACSTGYTDEFIQELLVILHEPEPNSFENKYKVTLTEIRNVLDTYYDDDWKATREIEKILQKISECEVEDE